MVKSLCMTLVYCPGLTYIQEGWQYHSLVDFQVGVKLSISLPDICTEPSECHSGFSSGKHVREMYTPLYLTFIVKLGYAGIYLFFLFLLQNIDCGYSLEPPRRGGSNVYPQSMFGAKIRKKINFFSAENFHFLQL